MRSPSRLPVSTWWPMAELCRCGHPLPAHSGTSVSGIPCRTCATQWRQGWPDNCTGWDPGGNVGPPPIVLGLSDDESPEDVAAKFEAGSKGVTGPPPDLDQAIHAATHALGDTYDWDGYDSSEIARIVLDAAAPALLQATRDRLTTLQDLLRQSIQLASRDEHGNCQYCKQPALEGRHGHCWHCGGRAPAHLEDCPVGAALDVAAAQENPQ